MEDKSLSNVLFGISEDRGKALAMTIVDIINDHYPDKKNKTPLREQGDSFIAIIKTLAKDETELNWIMLSLGRQLENIYMGHGKPDPLDRFLQMLRDMEQ